VKKGLTLVLLMVILIQSFSRWAIVIEYEFNKSYIAKALCINKSIPQMHCNGKCQVMKKLAEDADKNSPVKQTMRSFQPDPFVIHSINICADHPSTICQQLHTAFHFALPAQRSHSIFHPPCLV
jgi:hypothetical protein